MNYLFGFFIWWIIFWVICLSVYCFEWQTKNFVSTFRKYAQMILYMLFMLSGYIMAFLASYNGVGNNGRVLHWLAHLYC